MRTTFRWALVAVLALSTSALADTVTINWSNPVFNPNPGDTIAWSGTSSAGSGNTTAGRFHGSVSSFTGALTASAFVDSQANLWAYCADLLQGLHNGTYTVNYSVGARTLDFLGAVNYVLNGNSNVWLDSYAWLHPADRNVAAAIQAGIWESLYDTSGFDLASGTFRLTGLEAASATAYANFRTAVDNASVNDLPSSLAMLFVSGDNQDVVTGRRPRQQVPEPAAVVLIGLGLAAAGWTLRRKS